MTNTGQGYIFVASSSRTCHCGGTGIFLIPAIFYLVEKWSAGKERGLAEVPATPSPAPGD